jgi:DNA polymerase III subunit delta
VLIVATGATDKSRTAKLLIEPPDALVAMFYPPDLKDVAQAVRAMADAAGLRLGGDLAERSRAAPGSMCAAQSEIDKLALYLRRRSAIAQIRHEEEGSRRRSARATEEDGFAPLVNAVLGGETGPDRQRGETSADARSWG